MSGVRSTAGRTAGFRYAYGAEPLHLLAVLASFALAGYAFLRIFENPSTGQVLLWLGLAVIAHDFIALPLYSAFARIAEIGARATVRPRRRALLALNHVRAPAFGSLLLLVVYFPLIFEVAESNYRLTTGLGTDRYLGNWLAITGVLFAVSGLHLAWQLRRGDDRGTPVAARSESGDAARGEGVGLGWRIAARVTLAALALLTLWVVAIALFGLFENFPL